MESELIILIGNIGTGKSTESRNYAKKGYRIICRDAMRYMVGAGDYVFDERIERAIHSASLSMLRNLLLEGENIVVDETNVDKRSRRYLIELGKSFGYKIIAHEMHKAVMGTCLKNRERDTLRGNTLDVWASVWKKFNDRYQKPEMNEGFDEIKADGDR